MYGKWIATSTANAYIRGMGIVQVTPYIRLKHFRDNYDPGNGKPVGMTQVELARRVGVTQALISQIERGELLSFNLELLGKLARALSTKRNKVEPRDLVGDDGE